MIRPGILVVLALAIAALTAAVARAACNAHPMEKLQFHPDRATTPLLGPDDCELRAESATTATLHCGDPERERVYHLTWVRS